MWLLVLTQFCWFRVQAATAVAMAVATNINSELWTLAVAHLQESQWDAQLRHAAQRVGLDLLNALAAAALSTRPRDYALVEAAWVPLKPPAVGEPVRLTRAQALRVAVAAAALRPRREPAQVEALRAEVALMIASTGCQSSEFILVKIDKPRHGPGRVGGGERREGGCAWRAAGRGDAAARGRPAAARRELCRDKVA